MSHKKFGPDRFSRFKFIGYKQTDKQTDRQAKFIYRSAPSFYPILLRLMISTQSFSFYGIIPVILKFHVLLLFILIVILNQILLIAY